MSIKQRFEQEPIYLMDGSAFVYRGFYANQSMQRSDGFPTSALFIVARILMRILREEQPKHFAFVLDGHGPNFRHELFPLYKAQRSATPEDLIKQIDPIHRLIKALGLHLEVSDSCEADDCLASLAKRYREERPVILVATDKDLKQCLHDNVMMWDPASRDEKIVTLKSFEEETGLRPTQWPDVQAIIGDSSDNIPGVRGVGPKTAEKLFHEYASLEAIRDGFASMKPALQKKFDGQLEAMFLYRQLTTLKSTYADGLLKAMDPDGRVRTSFQMTVTATGRLSSTEPNLQNIPTRTDLGSEIRRMFIPADGCVLVDADYSQIELRLLAHISGDTGMQEAFLSGGDFHAETAAKVFHAARADVTPEMRRRAKAVNFGIVYGISAFSLSQDIGSTVAEAKAYMDAYFATFPGVRKYMDDVVEKAKETGYVETLFHRRRDLPELTSSNHNLRAFGERVALNMPIQGTAADIMKLAMVAVAGRLRAEQPDAHLVLQVHDELIVECPAAEAEAVAHLLEEEMENVVHLSVPLTAQAHWGKNWLEAKG